MQHDLRFIGFRRLILGFFALGLFGFFSLFCELLFDSSVFAAEIKSPTHDCGSLLTLDSESDSSDAETSFLGEKHSLTEFLSKDTTQNLAYLHPATIMDAFQFTASLILSHGVRKQHSPEHGAGSVSVYPVFSDGLPIVHGKRIIDQFSVINSFASHVFAGARGDGVRSKLFLLTGPAGTGKSEFLLILAELAKNLTNSNPDYFLYTYEWKGLSQIAATRPFARIEDKGNGEFHEHPLPCPLGHSPFILLPEAYQNKILELAGARAKKLAGGARPTPERELCPHCLHLKEAILRDYMDKHNLKSLTPHQVVQILDQHIDVKRVVIGKGGSINKINAEGKDVDYAGLFGEPNPVNSITFGPTHPFSTHIDGSVARANGSFLMLDEFFRNMHELRDIFLEVIENGHIKRGRSRVIKLDSVLVGASNDASIKAAMEMSPGTKAHLDRTRREIMRYPTSPYAITKTLLLMKGMHTVYQAELRKDSSAQELEIKPANLDDLFPASSARNHFLSSDRRYGLWFASEYDSKNGFSEDYVHISPHTLMYMASVMGATRMNTSADAAAKYLPNAKVIHSDVFSSIVSRIKFLKGELNITEGEHKELLELTEYLKEGETGLSARDGAGVWLAKAIEIARRDENHHCLTPVVAREALHILLAKGVIEFPNDQARADWLRYSDEIIAKLLIPEVEKDVQAAMSNLSGADNVYDEVFHELLALSEDATATQYTNSKTNEVRYINKARLEEIRAIYKAENQRGLNPQEMIQQYAHNKMYSKTEKKHAGLMNAVSAYLAKRVTELISYEDLERSVRLGNAGSSAEVHEKGAEMGHTMIHKLGYCPHCMRAALSLAKHGASATNP